MKLVLGCIVESIATRQDGSLKFTCGTQEMQPDDAGRLFQLRGKFAKVLLSDNNITPLEEKLVDEEKIHGGKKAKTPAQRLRNVLFRLHEDQGLTMPFDDFYKSEMEQIIDRYKEALND